MKRKTETKQERIRRATERMHNRAGELLTAAKAFTANATGVDYYATKAASELFEKAAHYGRALEAFKRAHRNEAS